MLNRSLLASLFALAACAAPQARESSSQLAEPLATEAQIIAAEAEPLSGDAADWNVPATPFNVIGNIHYVGAKGVSAFLITTPDGHILIDGGMAQTAPLILANIQDLGFNIRDVRYLLNSHAHFDHAAGLARLQRESGAQLVASESDRGPLEAGRFPYGPSAPIAFPPIRVDRAINDGDTLSLGGVTLTAHITAGHTPGCTSWTMAVTGADGAVHRAFFHCSATVAGQSLAPPAYPEIVSDFRATFAHAREVEADVLLTNHPEFMQMEARRARLAAGDANAFVDANALHTFNDRLERAFNEELARQTAAQN